MLKKYFTEFQMEQINKLENADIRRDIKEFLMKELIILFLKEALEKKENALEMKQELINDLEPKIKNPVEQQSLIQELRKDWK